MDDYEHPVTSSSNVVYVLTNIPGPGCREDDFQEEFAVGCSCITDCHDKCECTRGMRNYHDGRLIANDDKSIVECNPRCECTENCGNRIVQRGPIDCLIVRTITNKGLGLFSEKSINKGQFICEYAGEVISLDEARRRFEFNRQRQLMNYVLVVSEHIGDKKIITCVDPAMFGNIGRYANHSCQPNAIVVPVRVDITVPRICLFAKRDIEEGEEITFDYAGDSTSIIQNSETPCVCQTDGCRSYLPHCPV